jgi:hypothetical protein
VFCTVLFAERPVAVAPFGAPAVAPFVAGAGPAAGPASESTPVVDPVFVVLARCAIPISIG